MIVGGRSLGLNEYVENMGAGQLGKDSYFRTKEEGSRPNSRKPSDDKMVRFQEEGRNGVKRVFYDRDPQSRAGPGGSPER